MGDVADGGVDLAVLDSIRYDSGVKRRWNRRAVPLSTSASCPGSSDVILRPPPGMNAESGGADDAALETQVAFRVPPGLEPPPGLACFPADCRWGGCSGDDCGTKDSALDDVAGGTLFLTSRSLGGDGDSAADTTAPGTPTGRAATFPERLQTHVSCDDRNVDETRLDLEAPSKSKTAKRNQRRREKRVEAKALAPLMVAAAEAVKAAGPLQEVPPKAKAHRSYADMTLAERAKLKMALLDMVRKEEQEAVEPKRSITQSEANYVGTMSPLQLAEYGPDATRILVSVYGDIFDVSAHRDEFGFGGERAHFAGKDISWLLISQEACTANQFYDVFKAAKTSDVHMMLNCLCRWLVKYESRYGKPVGSLDVYSKLEKELPAPPAKLDGDCSLM